MSSFEKDPIRNLPLVTPPGPAKKGAAGWQIALTVFGAVAIVTVFLWGINNQRNGTAGQQSAATAAAPVVPQGTETGQTDAQRQAPSTTGQGGNGGGGDRPREADKAEQKPVDSNSEPAERQSK